MSKENQFANLFNKTLHEFVLNFPDYKDDIAKIAPIESIKALNQVEGMTVDEETLSLKIKYLFTYTYSVIKTWIGALIGMDVNPLVLYELFDNYRKHNINEFELLQSIENERLRKLLKTKIVSIENATHFIYETLLSNYDDRTLIYCMRNTCVETMLHMAIRIKDEKGANIIINLEEIKQMFVTEVDMKAWIKENYSANRKTLIEMISFYEFVSLMVTDGSDIPNTSISNYREECKDALYNAWLKDILLCKNPRDLRKVKTKQTLSWLML